MQGDDMLQVIVAVGRRRESPLGGTFAIREQTKFYVPLIAADSSGAEQLASSRMREALLKLLGPTS
jgi:hypothetical protein